jgi:diguanylate cyclase
VTYLERSDTASDFAQRALELMRRHSVAAHPQNFEIWYNYVSGAVPGLVRAVDRILADGREFPKEQLKALHAEYSPDAGDDAQLAEAAARLEGELGGVLEAFSRTGGNTREFGRALGAFAMALQGGDQSELKVAIANIVDATQEMRDHTEFLEGRLDQSLGEIRRLKDDLDAMREEAFTDALTRIPNRKKFDLELDRLSAEAVAEATDLSLLMLDIDHFKKFNDTFGHPIGDQVLRLLGATLKESVKGRDIPARYGGEEFAVILPDTRLADALVVAENIRRAIGSKKVVNKQTGEDLGKITVSIGASSLSADEAPENLIGRADEALYAAKRGGRNRVASERDIGQTTLSIAAETG